MADLDYLKEAQDAIKDDLVEEPTMSSSPLDSDEEVPSVLDAQDDVETEEVETKSSIWDEDEDEVEESSETPVDQTSDLQTLTYTADGQEFTATPEEAQKALSLMKGARRAFSERAKLKRQVKELQQNAEQGSQYKKYWEEAMQAANNPEQLFEKLSGKSFSEAVDREIQKRNFYETATDEQRQLFDYEEKFNSMEGQLKKVQEETQRKERELAEKASETRKQHLSGMLEPSFHEFTANLEERYTPIQANKLKKSLWRESIDDFKTALSKGYKPSNQLARKIFERNAAILIRDNKQQIEQGVQKVAAKKSEDAKVKAQLASQSNYEDNDNNINDLVKMDPMTLFQKMSK